MEENEPSVSSANCRRYCVQPIEVHTVINNTYTNPRSSTPKVEKETSFVNLAEDLTPVVPTQPLRPKYSTPSAVWHTNHSKTIQTEQPTADPHPAAEASQIRGRPGPVEYVTSEDPTATLCFNCQQMVVTYLYYQSGHLTYLTCIICAISGCDLGCCLLPFCMDQLKDRIHKCPKCHVILGKYKFI